MKSIQHFQKLCKEINFEITEELKNAGLREVEYDEKTLKFVFNISLEQHIKIATYKKLYDAIQKRFPHAEVYLYVENIILNKDIICDYVRYFIKTKYKNLRNFAVLWQPTNIKEQDGFLHITCPDLDLLKDAEKHTEDFLEILSNSGFAFENILFSVKEIQKSNYKSETLNNLSNKFEELRTFEKKMAKNSGDKKQVFFGKSRQPKKYVEMSLVDANRVFEDMDITTKGEIFAIDTRPLSNDKVLYTISISDYKEAINVKKFYAKDDPLPDLKIGDTVIVNGLLTNDSFTKVRVIMGASKGWYTETDGYHKLPEDNDIEKRVELAVRSNMSTQDGIGKPEEYISAAEHYGHEAIALTDLDSIQNFPGFVKAAKKSKVKPIYGATFSAINAKNQYFYGFKSFDLADAEYVVFDIETTGLSPRFDEIIEFGATVYKKNSPVENIQFFLKASQPLSAFTINLTNITDSMLEQGYEQEEGIRKIYEILKDKIAVAHNANFDINFCKEQFEKLGLDKSRIVGLDTLAVSHFLNPYEKKHTLGAVAKRYDVSYNSEVAHRGDYDAAVLGKIWQAMILRLSKEFNIKTSDELNQAFNPKMLGRRFSYEIRVLAKNPKGIKKLFELISIAMTKQFNEGPKLYYDLLTKDPDYFIGSGAHQSYLWEQVFNGTNENILKAMQPYDYIELPPISSFEYMIKEGRITLNNLRFAYKDLIAKADSLGIPCVAVTDCRYVYDYQKLIHEIYINAPTLGGGLHWLKRKAVVPDFKYLTTSEMIAEFAFLDDINLIKKIVVENTRKIAAQVENNINVFREDLCVPTYDNSAENLRKTVYESIKERYGDNPEPSILERVEQELTPIIKYGYSVIYWIAYKLVKRSNKDGYIVGSRGSVGSSVVANLVGISEVNPLDPHYLCPNCKFFEWIKDPNIYSSWDLPDRDCPKCGTRLIQDGHSIPFSTFLGFNADKVPDIDLNFGGAYQPTIHNYVKELFGENHTFRAGTVSTVASKTAYGFCKKYEEEKRNKEEPWSKNFLEFLASKTAGVKRTTSQHPGGIIVVPREMDAEDFFPVNFPANDDTSTWMTTHLDYRSMHDNVLKLDLLGKDDPTFIKMLEDLTGVKVDQIPKFDPNIIKLFYTTESLKIKPEDIGGETTGAYALPEFGTTFVRKMLTTAKPHSFNDLILISGLSHGTNVWAGNAEELVKQGKKLNDCVCCREDILNELVRHNVDKLVAFKIMEKVRKGKGITEDEEKMLYEKGVPEYYIESLKIIEYLFPRAHATAYVIMAYRFGFYKVYYPLPFYATFYTIKPDSLDIQTMSKGLDAVKQKLTNLRHRSNSKVEKLTTKEEALIPILEITQELYARGFKIRNVDLNKSKATEWIIDEADKALIPPFNVVEGLGDVVAESIVEAREQGEFLSIEDLGDRTKLNSRIITELTNLGVLDGLEESNQSTLF
ncbi:PolC-type DNA polymerase III [[Mycoplasma] falconis]|uniref:DNA polymerase III PolC-type n=1 Tax=[Mycoplasma] falconis TaxID=92403 RepID=A0A501XBP7_9BACT|nr:PolC-type DNA polymerase III [[Mycoplasma] falconis]TPE57724.1 PolC-type DNA polymerase III [[Mycoplasma] falconis]